MDQLRHVLLRNPRLNGWEYGMLRAFEKAIVEETNAAVIDVPDYGWKPILKRAGHGMRLNTLRNKLPKKKLALEADVLWYILMGPEELELDLFEGWDKIKYRVVYLYDTLPPQFPVLKKAFSGNGFTHRITSFNDAIPQLESITANKWHVIEQAVPQNFFTPALFDQRVIHFSSYGRRLPSFHNELMDFCKANHLYYDYTTHDGKHPTADTMALYKQYAWHLSHSLFTISWPVEVTNPVRAGNLHPITCRWFEALAAGAVIIGKAPANDAFEQYVGKDLVTELDHTADKHSMYRQLEHIWMQREALFAKAQIRREEKSNLITWNTRVQQVLQLL